MQAHVLAPLHSMFSRFKERCPQTPLIYFPKGTNPHYWEKMRGLPFECLAVDWLQPLPEVLERWSGRWSIQGNIDPTWLLEPDTLEARLRMVFNQVHALSPESRAGWVCGLGHGVLPGTPEESVRLFLRVQREIFGSAA